MTKETSLQGYDIMDTSLSLIHIQMCIRDRDLLDVKIPVPNLTEKERVVDLVRKFDALCNNVSTGLPAEIEMRQKQYAYYRDKLLTFKQIP